VARAKQRDAFARRLWLALPKRKHDKAYFLGNPGKMLEEACGQLGIVCEGLQIGKDDVCRANLGRWLEFHFFWDIKKVLGQEANSSSKAANILVLSHDLPENLGEWEKLLSDALAQKYYVKIEAIPREHQ
jgi:hypothetical protein